MLVVITSNNGKLIIQLEWPNHIVVQYSLASGWMISDLELSRQNIVKQINGLSFSD